MATNPGAYPPAPPKKSNFLIWLLAGIGGLFLIGFAVVVGGGLFIAHKVKDFADVHDGKMVIKDHGKDVVISSGQGSDGSLEVKSADGTVKIGTGADAKLPAWMPAYPGAANQGVYSAQTDQGASGSFSFNTSDSPAKVSEFYQEKFKASGLKIGSTVQTGEGNIIVAEDEGKKHTATVIVGSSDGQTTASVTYVQH